MFLKKKRTELGYMEPKIYFINGTLDHTDFLNEQKLDIKEKRLRVNLHSKRSNGSPSLKVQYGRKQLQNSSG